MGSMMLQCAKADCQREQSAGDGKNNMPSVFIGSNRDTVQERC
jgi:hypothetical protein